MNTQKAKISFPILYQGVEKTADLLDFFIPPYFKLYDIPFEKVFKYIPILEFVHAIFYSLDVSFEEDMNGDKEKSKAELKAGYINAKTQIVQLLQEKGYYDSFLEESMQKIDEYAELEYALLVGDVPITQKTIMAAADLRFQNVRFLHHLLIRILNKSYGQAFLDTLWPIETLIDLYTDLEQYTDDCLNDTYNSYRMLVHLYREKAPEKMQELLDYYKDTYKKNRAKLPLELQDRVNTFYQNQGYFMTIEIPDPRLEDSFKKLKP